MIATPNNGTPLGGQTVTLTGEAFGASQSLPVLVAGVEAEVVSWSNSAVVITTPRVPFSAGLSAVTWNAKSAVYTVNRPLADLAEEELVASLAAATVDDGFYFNHTSAGQVKALRADPWADDSSDAYPRSFLCHILGNMENDEPYGYDKNNITIMVVGIVKSGIEGGGDLNSLCHFYAADIAKALCTDRGVGGVVNDVRITQIEFMGSDVTNTMEVNVLLAVQVQHYFQNHNKNQGSVS